MRSIQRVLPLILGAVGLLVSSAGAQQVIKENVDGIVNFNRIETTVACAGAIKPSVIPEIKRRGYKSIINLRLASEPGAEIEASKAAAAAAGITYFHIPYSVQNPSPAVVDDFLKAITTPGVEPAFIH